MATTNVVVTGGTVLGLTIVDAYPGGLAKLADEGWAFVEALRAVLGLGDAARYYTYDGWGIQVPNTPTNLAWVQGFVAERGYVWCPQA